MFHSTYSPPLWNPKIRYWVTLDCDRDDYNKDYDSQGCDVTTHNLGISTTDTTENML
jgi:hypothetical protein